MFFCLNPLRVWFPDQFFTDQGSVAVHQFANARADDVRRVDLKRVVCVRIPVCHSPDRMTDGRRDCLIGEVQSCAYRNKRMP